MEVLIVVSYFLLILLLIISIILAIKCIKFIDSANNCIMEIENKLKSCNYIFDIIDNIGSFMLNIPNLFKRKDR